MYENIIACKSSIVKTEEGKSKVFHLLDNEGKESIVDYTRELKEQMLINFGYFENKNKIENRELLDCLKVIVASGISFPLIAKFPEYANVLAFITPSIILSGFTVIGTHDVFKSKKVVKEYDEKIKVLSIKSK